MAEAYARTGGGVRFNFGASNVLARQVVNGAPVDVFISADEAQMDVVAAAGLVKDGSRVRSSATSSRSPSRAIGRAPSGASARSPTPPSSASPSAIPRRCRRRVRKAVSAEGRAVARRSRRASSQPEAFAPRWPRSSPAPRTRRSSIAPTSASRSRPPSLDGPRRRRSPHRLSGAIIRDHGVRRRGQRFLDFLRGPIPPSASSSASGSATMSASGARSCARRAGKTAPPANGRLADHLVHGCAARPARPC